MNKKGFVIIIAATFAASLLVLAVAIISMSSGEISQTKIANDTEKAYYVALSGAEKMYEYLKSKEGEELSWPQAMPGADCVVGTRASGGATIGAFTATADRVAGTTDRFGIVSRGTASGRSATITVIYGCNDTESTKGRPIGSRGTMSLNGNKLGGLRSWVRAEGPLASGSTVDTNNFVKITGDVYENQPFAEIDFWWAYDAAADNWTPKAVGDADGNTEYLTDANGDGSITIADAGDDPAQQAIFTADDLNSDGVVDDKDAFKGYYTIELNKLGLNIGEGESQHYDGDQEFDPTSVPAGTPIIFVEGNVDIFFSDTEWWGADVDHTIVATGDITITQPTNNSGDTLTLIAFGDVNTGGVRAFGGVRGDLVVYANSDFNAWFGGRTNGTIFANGEVDIDTLLPIPGLLNRDLNKGTIDWTDPSAWPLGLPRDYSTIRGPFEITDETVVIPVWQRE
ncbi:MAG: hypothetical protein V1927_01870 [Candidatus Omnitrophota bacterium]